MAALPKSDSNDDVSVENNDEEEQSQQETLVPVRAEDDEFEPAEMCDPPASYQPRGEVRSWDRVGVCTCATGQETCSCGDSIENARCIWVIFCGNTALGFERSEERAIKAVTEFAVLEEQKIRKSGYKVFTERSTPHDHVVYKQQVGILFNSDNQQAAHFWCEPVEYLNGTYKLD